MNLERVKLPPVSKKFYDTLVDCFPPLDPLDIKEGTTMISIQRRAAQEEVLNMIKAVAVQDDKGNVKRNNIWDKFSLIKRGK